MCDIGLVRYSSANLSSVSVDAGINQIYVAAGYSPGSPGTTLTVIDGGTNANSTLAVGAAPAEAAVNPATHRVYVRNFCGTDLKCNTDGPVKGTVTVVEAAR